MIHTQDDAVEIYLNHKTTFAEKLEDTWYIPMIDYYIDLAKNLNDNQVVLDYLDAAKGVIKKDVYDEILKQINDKNKTVKIDELEVLDDVDIITPIKERYMGEYVKTPNFYSVTNNNPDIALAIKNKVQRRIYSILVSKLKLLLEKMKVDLANNNLTPEQIDAEMAKLDIPEEVQKIKEEFFEKETSKAKKIVQYFIDDLRIEEKFYQLFYYFFATEKVCVELVPKANHIEFNIISPQDYYRIPAENSIFTEDDEAGVIIEKRTIRDILDDFSDQMTDDDIKYLNSLVNGEFSPSSIPVNVIENRFIDNTALKSYVQKQLSGRTEVTFSQDVNSVVQYKVYCKTKRKIGILTYMAQDGVIETRIVGDTYIPDFENGDISIEWEWEDEVWVGYRFGDKYGTGIYLPMKPIQVQRSELSVKNSAKIPIIGIDGLNKYFGRKPVPARMLSHQAFYIILTNKLRKEIAKFHGFVNLIAESILSDSEEFSQAARLEYMFKDSLLIFNDEEVDVNVLQTLRTIGNTGQADYISVLDNIRKSIKAEAWDLANMNAERYGQIDTKGGMSNTQEAIRRVSTGSVFLFTMFDMFKERLYQAISDYGRIVYIDGIKTNFMDAHKELVELDINHEELISSELGIHFTTNSIEKDKIEMIRNAIASTNIQTGNMLDAINALKEDDLASLKTYAEKLQEQKNKREEMLAKQEQDAKKYVEDRKKEIEQMKISGDYQTELLKSKTDLLIEDKKIYAKMLEIEAQREMFEAGLDSNGNGIPDEGNRYDKDQFYADKAFLENEIRRATKDLTNEKVKTEKLRQQQMRNNSGNNNTNK